MTEHEEGQDDDIFHPEPRPHKPIGLTPMKAKRAKAPEKPPPPRK